MVSLKDQNKSFTRKVILVILVEWIMIVALLLYYIGASAAEEIHAAPDRQSTVLVEMQTTPTGLKARGCIVFSYILLQSHIIFLDENTRASIGALTIKEGVWLFFWIYIDSSTLSITKAKYLCP